VVFATALALAAAVSLAFAGKAHATPNILVIVTDDQELQGTMALMPKTTKWFNTGDAAAGIAGGTEFTNASITTPLCCPARASIFTGQYAHNHGVERISDAPKLDQSTTIQHYLQQAGYRTGIFGKFLNEWDVTINPPNWTDWAILENQSYTQIMVNEQGTLKSLWKYSTNYVAEQTEQFLQNADTANDSQPWFLYVAPTTPHGPYFAEPKYANASVPAQQKTAAWFEQDRTDKPYWVQSALADADSLDEDFVTHYRMLKTADDLVDGVMQKLHDLNEDNDTLAFFISDNGYQWGEHGIRTKKFPYLESTRVPMYLRWPGWTGHAGTWTDTRLVSNIDIAPTAMAAAGLTPPSPMDGTSLLNVGASQSRAITEAWGGGTGGSGECPGSPPTWAGIHTTTFHYIEYYESTPASGTTPCGEGTYVTNFNNVIDREYYDVRASADPNELTNLLGDEDPTNDPPVGELTALLASARTCAGASCSQGPSDPDTAITERPAGTSGSSTATFTFTSSEPNSSFQCRLDDAFGGGPFVACPSHNSWTNLSNGSHELEVRAVSGGVPDSTPDSYTWTVDTSFPETQITQGPSGLSNTRNPTFQFTSPDNTATFQCRLDSNAEADFQSCSSPKSYSNLADGAHTFDVRAVRANAQTDPTPASRTWNVDATAPNTEITPTSTLSTHSNYATFDLQSFVSSSSNVAETPSRLECSLDSGPYTPCTSPKTFERLSKGAHTVRARSTDLAGNTDPTPAAFSWTIGTVQTYSSTTDNTWPYITEGSEVRAIVPDGSGGFYIAGDFTEIGYWWGPRWRRTDLAHIKADRTVDETWAPSTDGGGIKAAVRAGSTIYLGGTFTGIKGTNDSTFTPRNRLAAVSTAGGNLNGWNPNASNDVNALMFGPPLYTGAGVSTVYAAGAFNNIGGVARGKIAEIKLADGTLTSWNPSANGGATINALATNERYVYAGGTNLTQIGGKARNNLAEIDRFTGQATDWDPNPNGSVMSLGLRRMPVGGLPAVYVGGLFTTIGNPAAARNKAAEVNITDNGSVTAWDPSPSNYPLSFLALGCTLRCTVVLGGAFDELASTGGSPVARKRLADTDLSTGEAQDWNPGIDRAAYAFACSTGNGPTCGGTLAVGGIFNLTGSIGGPPVVARGRLAFFSPCPLSGPC
jgi:arylsulfatase A-like enzyme